MQVHQRLLSIDVLRGVALLGILVMNIQAFAMPSAAYLNPTLYGSLAGLDGVAWFVTRLFFDLKFLSLFSLLFGASLVLARDPSTARRRLGWLVVFGLLHGYLLFFGDILFTYGVVGTLVLPARTWSPGRQLRVGLALIATSVFLGVGLALLFEAQLSGAFELASVGREVASFRGPWWEQLPVRAELTFTNQVLLSVSSSGWRAAGFMLLGMAAVRARVFEPGFRFDPRGWLLFPASLSLSALGLGIQWASAFSTKIGLVGQLLHELGTVGVAGGIGLLVIRLTHRFHDRGWVRAIGRLGRVAFSAYLSQSLIASLVFGGHGLGQYGTWGRAELLVAPFVLWAIQIAAAVAWTRRFRFGPLEALWRGLYSGDFSLGRPSPRIVATPGAEHEA